MHNTLRRILPILTILAGASGASLLAAQQDPVDQLEKQLVQLFERPAGTPITQEQKQALGEWVDANGAKLGRLGYVRGLHSYLMRDPEKATTQLDAFFSKHKTIANDEHRMMAGRIYMTAFVRLAATKDPSRDKLCRYGEITTRIYANLALLARYMPRGLASLDDKDTAAAARLALARGALDSGAPTSAQDDFMKAIYAGAAPATNTGRSGRRTGARSGAAKKPTPDAIKRDALTGNAAPALPADLVLNGKFDSIRRLKGKVVLVDFWATWCGPCRSVIPDLVKLQKKHGDAVQVLGATRFYGYGSDFSSPNAKPPHGGAKMARNLERGDEIAINETFAKVFELNYPIVFINKKTFGEYGIRGIPTIFVIGRDGKVVGHAVGSKSHDKLEALIEKALGQKN